jgi:hypothetical protein
MPQTNNIIERGLNKLPGGQNTKVLAGVVIAFGFLGATFFGGKAKKPGEGAFDTEKPQSVQESQDRAEANRLSRFKRN